MVDPPDPPAATQHRCEDCLSSQAVILCRCGTDICRPCSRVVNGGHGDCLEHEKP